MYCRAKTSLALPAPNGIMHSTARVGKPETAGLPPSGPPAAKTVIAAINNTGIIKLFFISYLLKKINGFNKTGFTLAISRSFH